MRLAEDNDVVQALAPDRTDQPLGKAILPGRGWCNWLISNARGAKSACDNGAVYPIAAPDQIARSLIPRKSLGDRSCNPFRWARQNVPVRDLSVGRCNSTATLNLNFF